MALTAAQEHTIDVFQLEMWTFTKEPVIVTEEIEVLRKKTGQQVQIYVYQKETRVV